MKTLSKSATLTFQKLICKMGTESHLKLNQGGESIMPVIIEQLYADVDFNGIPMDIYCLAHYYEQNGDLVPDPDMTFAVSKNTETIYPMTFQNALGYQEAISQMNGKWMIKTRAQHDQASFANMWLKNIKWQQNL